MKRWLPWTVVALALLATALPGVASAYEPWCGSAPGYQASPWHGSYYHAAWGAPVALVVPPTARHQTHWGWGVGNTRITPITPKFQAAYPGPIQPVGFLPAPAWPSDTDQYGVYYVRGPW